MKKIKSFQVDHTKIDRGLYISRVDGDITTYDLRMVKPNVPPFLTNAGIHSFEHLLATYLRNSKFSDNIVYVGPMGCRTGFYILTRNMDNGALILTLNDALEFISEFTGEIPGNSAKECGNYLDHDIVKAIEYAKEMQDILKEWTVEKLNYNS